MARIRQVRAWRNLIGLALLCSGLLWWLDDRLRHAPDALAWGAGLAVPGSLMNWRFLSRRITRADRRYERNKIPVRYLTAFEALVALFAESYYLAIPVVLILVIVALSVSVSGHWWTVMGATWGLVWATILTACIWVYEWRHGPLHYQYDNSNWTGAEGLIYQCGTVVQPLAPAGKVNLPGGVLWNAVSQSGETIDAGTSVEVIDVQQLTLYVDRLPDSASVDA